MRADQLLVERGLAASRAQAQRLIAAGVEARCVNAWRRVGKNGEALAADVALRLLDDAEARYVSRGGLKLEGALRQTGLNVCGLTCLDAGQSTGGFTHCLLLHGAAHVVGIDVGHGQLHPRLAADPRVTSLEGINARGLTATELVAKQEALTSDSGGFDSKVNGLKPTPREFALIVGDLSFISLSLVLSALVALLGPHGALLMLVKPQFELQPGQLGKRGIVRNERLYLPIERRLRADCEALGLDAVRWFDSSILGGDGNREFFIFARKPS